MRLFAVATNPSAGLKECGSWSIGTKPVHSKPPLPGTGSRPVHFRIGARPIECSPIFPSRSAYTMFSEGTFGEHRIRGSRGKYWRAFDWPGADTEMDRPTPGARQWGLRVDWFCAYRPTAALFQPSRRICSDGKQSHDAGGISLQTWFSVVFRLPGQTHQGGFGAGKGFG